MKLHGQLRHSSLTLEPEARLISRLQASLLQESSHNRELDTRSTFEQATNIGLCIPIDLQPEHIQASNSRSGRIAHTTYYPHTHATWKHQTISRPLLGLHTTRLQPELHILSKEEQVPLFESYSIVCKALTPSRARSPQQTNNSHSFDQALSHLGRSCTSRGMTSLLTTYSWSPVFSFHIIGQHTAPTCHAQYFR